MKNTYWNRNGAAQAKLEEMTAAGWEFTKATQNHMHRYYRYYNDGDAPSRIRWLLNLLGSAARENREVLAHEAKLEAQATARIEIEYSRFLKARAAQLSNQ